MNELPKTIQPDVKLDLNTISLNTKADSKFFIKNLAHHFNVHEDELLLYASKESLFFSLCKYFSWIKNFQGECFIYEPLKSNLKTVAFKFFDTVKSLNSLDNQLHAIHKGDLVICENPRSIDGKYQDLYKRLEYWIKKEAIIVLDESLLDFCLKDSLVSMICKYENLYIIKSFQEFYNLKALSLSALISCKQNIELVQNYEANDVVSKFDLSYLNEVLKDKNFKRIYQAITAKNMILLKQVLELSNLFERVYESNTNTLLAKLSNMNAKVFIQEYEESKLRMNECSNESFLDELFIQFTVHNEDEIIRLVELFQKRLKEE